MTKTSLETKFLAFHIQNPQVYRQFERFAAQAIRAGRTILSASLIFERIRWETQVLTSDPDYKLNNNHRAYYARLWMETHPFTPIRFRTRVVATHGHAA